VFLHDHFVQDSGLNAYTNAFYMTLTILGGVPYGNMALHSGIEKGFTMILIGVGFKLLFAWVYRSLPVACCASCSHLGNKARVQFLLRLCSLLSVAVGEMNEHQIKHEEKLGETIGYLRFRKLPPQVSA
jgi:hypothetical protein